jgi:hypothetical protein
MCRRKSEYEVPLICWLSPHIVIFVFQENTGRMTDLEIILFITTVLCVFFNEFVKGSLIIHNMINDPWCNILKR